MHLHVKLLGRRPIFWALIMVRFKKWIQLDFGILQISLHVYVGIIEGDALIREYESNCYKYVSYTL